MKSNLLATVINSLAIILLATALAMHLSGCDARARCTEPSVDEPYTSALDEKYSDNGVNDLCVTMGYWRTKDGKLAVITHDQHRGSNCDGCEFWGYVVWPDGRCEWMGWDSSGNVRFRYNNFNLSHAELKPPLTKDAKCEEYKGVITQWRLYAPRYNYQKFKKVKSKQKPECLLECPVAAGLKKGKK